MVKTSNHRLVSCTLYVSNFLEDALLINLVNLVFAFKTTEATFSNQTIVNALPVRVYVKVFA